MINRAIRALLLSLLAIPLAHRLIAEGAEGVVFGGDRDVCDDSVESAVILFDPPTLRSGQDASKATKFGVRFGSWFVWNTSATLFVENQFMKNWAVRTGAELTHSNEGPIGFPGPGSFSGGVRHRGLLIDGLYYFNRHDEEGPKHYAFTGVGFYKTTMDGHVNGYGDFYYSTNLPVFSCGGGVYLNRFLGLELKLSFSTLKIPYPDNPARNWVIVSVIFRTP